MAQHEDNASASEAARPDDADDGCVGARPGRGSGSWVTGRGRHLKQAGAGGRPNLAWLVRVLAVPGQATGQFLVPFQDSGAVSLHQPPAAVAGRHRAMPVGPAAPGGRNVSGVRTRSTPTTQPAGTVTTPTRSIARRTRP